MRRTPAAPAAALFIFGILLHNVAPHRPILWLGAMGAFLIAATFVIRRPIVCSACIALAIVTGGLVSAQEFAFFFPRDHIWTYAGDEPRLAQAELYIEQPPRILTNPFDPRRALPPKQITSARIVRIRTWDGWTDASGDLLVQIAQPLPNLAAGQTVRVTGLLQRPAPSMNPGQFDWASYYREQRVLNSFSIPHARNIQIIHDDPPPMLTRAREYIRRLLATGFAPERSLDHALLRALLLGDHDPQLRDVQDQFQRTGTSHHLAISGMHVAVLGGVIYFLCRLLCVPPRWAAVVATSFVIFYGAMALPSPPVIRSVLLAAAFGLGVIFRRSLDPLQLLAVSVLAMLGYHPLDLYNAGFQLSVGTVFALMLLGRTMYDTLNAFRDRDVEIAEKWQRPSLWTRARRWTNHWILASLAAGLVAWGVSMPLIAAHFEQLNPWAIVAGILLGPIVFVALIGGFLKVVLTLLWPAGAETFASLAAYPVQWMRWSVEQLGKLPESDVPVPPPPVWLMLIFFALVATALWRDKKPATRILLVGGRVLAAGAMVILPLQRGVAKIHNTGDVRVTILAVGAGQCAVVQTPGGRTLLLDAGSSSLSDLRAKCLGPFLRHADCTQIDTVVMSHGDLDHISAVEEVVGAYGVREVLVGSSFTAHAPPGSPVEELLRGLDKLERPPRTIAPGDRIPLGRDTAIEVLWPPRTGKASTTNDSCLVLKLTHAGRTILFPGDIQDGAMTGLLKEPAQLKADVLIAAHHGSSETLTPKFVAAVDPGSIVSSNDRTLTHKQREFEKMIGNRTLYRTNRTGAVTIVLTREGEVRVEPFLSRK